MAMESILKFYSYDIQPDGIIKPSSILKQMQQIAREDLDQFGLTYDKLRELNMVFVLIKINLQLHKPITAYDNLKLITTPRRVIGATFIRDFVITDGLQNYAECTSAWVLIDFEARRPLRPSTLPCAIPGDRENELLLPLEKTFFLEGDICDVGERRVFYSYLDENNHLNNTVYADFINDYMPEQMRLEKKRISSLKINFLNEAYHGDQMNMKRICKDNQYIISAENITAQKDCFLALVAVE